MKKEPILISDKIRPLETTDSEDAELMDIIKKIAGREKPGFIMAAYFEDVPEGTKRTCAFVANEMSEVKLVEQIASIGAHAMSKAAKSVEDGII